MNNKYYTPTIDEFHVGFEYERYIELNPDWVDGQSGWMKVKFPNDPIYGSTLNSGRFKCDSARVKYLDDKDIESLGFKFIMNMFLYSTYKLNNYHIFEVPCKQNEYIIKSDDWNKGDVLFQGTIKNKSELKVLLKQLNIY